MKQFEYDVLENAKTYLNQLKDDLENQKTKLMDIYIDVHEHQKDITTHIDSLKSLLGNHEKIKVTYDWNKTEVIEVPLSAKEKQNDID